MSYKYLDDIATADIAFEASGKTLSEMFLSAADAILHVMLLNPKNLEQKETFRFEFTDADLDLLLLNFLQEIIYLKDARRTFAQCVSADIEEVEEEYHLHAEFKGDVIDQKKHLLGTDVKAVTMHQLQVENNGLEWVCRVVLDI